MKKIGILFAAVIMMLMFAVSASAVTETGTCGENITWTLDKITGLLVIEGNGDMEDFYPGENDRGEPNWGYGGEFSSPKIPYGNFEYYRDHGVYRDCTVKYVIVKDGVTSIGYNAFNYFYSLIAVELPESITDIDESAFGGYNNLTTVYYKGTSENFSRIKTGNYNSSFKTAEIVYGGSLDREMIKKEVRRSGTCGDNLTWTYDETGLLKIDGTGAMYAYENFGEVAPWRSIEYLLAVEIGDGVTNIGQYAFYDCQRLKSIKLGKSLVTIDFSAFSGCYNVETVIIPNGVTKIDDSAFADCSNLKSVTIPESVTTIGSWVFENCTSLETIKIPNSANELGGYSFYGCKNLSSVIISNNISVIDVGLFEGCSKLESIIIPDGVTVIENYAFSGCLSLDEIIIPDSLVYLGDAFWSTAYYNDVANWENGALYIGKHLIELKEDFSGNYEVKPGTITIAGNACYGCEELTSITIPESLVSIGSGAFFCSYNLNDVYFSGSQKQWSAIEIASNNDCLNGATIHFAKGCSHTNIETLKAAGATCEKTGLTEGKKCSDCGEIIVAQNVVAKKPHTEVTLKAKVATCTSTGLTTGKKCSVCGTVTVAQKTVAKKAHSYKTTTTKATLSKNGSVVTACSVCGAKKSTTTVYYPKTIKLSATSYTYNGKAKTPTVIVKDSKGKTLKNNTDYTVKYASGRKNPGKYSVTVTFKGKYSGTKKLTFTIKPAQVTLSKLTAGSKQVTVAWKSISGASGYEVQYSTSKNMKSAKTATVKKGTTTKTTIKKLTKGKTYYVKVRAYKTVDGKKIYGAWSAVKSVKIK